MNHVKRNMFVGGAQYGRGSARGAENVALDTPVYLEERVTCREREGRPVSGGRCVVRRAQLAGGRPGRRMFPRVTSTRLHII